MNLTPERYVCNKETMEMGVHTLTAVHDYK